MTVILRLAGLGCLAAVCAVTTPLAMLGLILLAVALFLVSLHGRVPWCWCGHGKTVHEHYGRGTHCALCPPDRPCGKYEAPFIWRRS